MLGWYRQVQDGVDLNSIINLHEPIMCSGGIKCVNYCQYLTFCGVFQSVWLHQWHTTRHDICCCLFVVFHTKLNSRPSTCRQPSSPVAFLIKNSHDLGSRSHCVRIEHVEPMQRSKSKGWRTRGAVNCATCWQRAELRKQEVEGKCQSARTQTPLTQRDPL